MCLLAQIGAIIFGIIALVRGQFSLTRTRIVWGVPARIIGFLLCLPLPVSFGIGLLIGIALVAQGKDVRDPAVRAKFWPVDVAVFLFFLVAAGITAFATAQPVKQKRRRRPREEYVHDDEEEDFEEWEEEDRPRRRRRRLPVEDEADEEEPPRQRRRPSPPPDERFQA